MTSTLRERRVGAGDSVTAPPPSNARLDLLDEFNTELERLSAMQRELLQELRSDGCVDLDADDSPGLREENERLRARVEELEQLLQASATAEAESLEQRGEYEKLLEEKSEVIRALHLKIQELQQAPPAAAPAEKLSDAAATRMRQELEEQRRQLEEDEAAMMEQMRTMELALAKDRAELARMRTELQRQQTDFAREVEIASRDSNLRERLANLRRPQDTPARKSTDTPAPPTVAPASTPKSSGLIRRLFG
jgi:myosin heavy subunit